MFHPRPLHGVSVSSPLPVRPSPERSPPKLCENGRAYITDPSTGQNVCLCQLEAHPAHSLQAHPALRGVRPIPAPRPLHGGSFHPHAAAAAAAAQLSAMTPLGEQTNGLLAPHIAFHPYGAMYASMDGAGSPLRRAATRETTGPLKAWLSEHKKNPYPTKAEKIMLAIITRMTLTQVSTWFANARRRLKKDNRLSSGDGDAEDDTSTLDIDSDKEGDSDTASLVIPSTPTTRHIEDRPMESRTHDREELDLPSKHDSSTPMIRRVGGGKLSSEGEVDQDSFSDISDDENENMFRSMRNRASAHRGQPISCADTRVAVITSQALPSTISHETEVVRTRPEHQQTTTSSPEPGLSGVDLSITSTNSHVLEKKPEAAQTKPKPKIWSISHILDS